VKRFIAVLLILAAVISGACAEDERFILCNPTEGNYVCIRRSPMKHAKESGRLECGDRIRTDGKVRNGYLHILGMTEDGEGWVHSGYVVNDEPVIRKCMASVAASGRVMARRNIRGKRTAWLAVCSEVRVYARSEEWAVTNRGFVRTEYLEVWYE